MSNTMELSDKRQDCSSVARAHTPRQVDRVGSRAVMPLLMLIIAAAQSAKGAKLAQELGQLHCFSPL